MYISSPIDRDIRKLIDFIINIYSAPYSIKKIRPGLLITENFKLI